MTVSGPSRTAYLFGPFRIDAEDRILWRDDKEVPLTRKAAETLLFLLENAGHVVEKEALLTHVWPDTFVEESTLAQNILTLRKTLGKQSNGQEYIGTVPKRGYRFEAAVAKEAEGRIFSSVTPKPEKAPVRSWWPWTVATGVVAFVLLLGVAFSLTWHRNPIQRGKIETRVRLAVLPFTNLGGDASQEYLSEGLTEEMITQLGSLNPDRLAVIARTSAMIYRNTSKDARQIGQELNVDFLLGGSVRLEGARIRVSTQLVRVSDQSTLWAANYDRDLRNILALENDVARSVASQIALRLTPEKAAFLEEPHPLDPEAYENYLEARHFWNRRTPETISKAIQLLQRAIARDPAYAQAHAALADCFVIQFIYSQTSGADALRKARAEANKALELDSSRGEPHATLASSYLYDWDFPNAEVEFQNSIRLAPRYATAHQWYAEYLSFMGREQEAITEYNRALEIDPLSSAINVEAALPYYYLGDNDRAIAQLRRTIDLDPYFASAHGHLAMALDAKGIYQEALQECLAAKALGDAPWIEITLGLVYAHLGRTADTRKVLQILKGPPTGGPASGADMLFFALGDTEGTLRGLEKEVAAHNPLLVGLAVNPQYKSLRKHPRFQEILRLIGFPEQLQYKPATGLPGS